MCLCASLAIYYTAVVVVQVNVNFIVCFFSWDYLFLLLILKSNSLQLNSLDLWLLDDSSSSCWSTDQVVVRTSIYYIHSVQKKTPTFVSFITLSFLGRFLYLFYQWKQELILYREVDKIYNIILTVSPHYVTKNNTLWDDCGRPLPVVRLIEPVIRNFHRKLYNVHLF